MSVKLRPGSAGAPVKIDYEFPSWCGRAPPGTHLDVMKDDKLIEKLLIDEKKYYIFGRNNEMCDFITNHASCSRAHAAILYHKILKKAFVVDLKSAHGTFLGYKRLEPHVPIQLPADIQVFYTAIFKGSSDTSHFISEYNVGKSRIRHSLCHIERLLV